MAWLCFSTLNKKFEVKFERISLPQRGLEPGTPSMWVRCANHYTVWPCYESEDPIDINQRHIVCTISIWTRAQCTVGRKPYKTAKNKFPSLVSIGLQSFNLQHWNFSMLLYNANHPNYFNKKYFMYLFCLKKMHLKLPAHFQIQF